MAIGGPGSSRWAACATCAALEKIAADSSGTITLLDLKQASEDLVARQRVHILWSLAIAAVLLALTVFAALRSPRRMLRVIAPMAMTTLLILAVLQALGVSLNLFHLIALVLAAGLGRGLRAVLRKRAKTIRWSSGARCTRCSCARCRR